MKKYESPSADLIRLDEYLDVITTSAPPVAGDYNRDRDQIDFEIFR
ncbi:MAG: hypothetical protein J5885_04110 [Clostridia bacterium]|nr:hypothetical protein [Clostridia bacterium]